MKALHFTSEQREQLRTILISLAHNDPRITGAALVGSSALGKEDRWSDIDLALCLADWQDSIVVQDWTNHLYQELGAVTHLDIHASGALYRVFLLANTLQVDLSFWSTTAFSSTSPAFQLLFGTTNTRPPIATTPAAHYVGMAWLHALHVRSALAREKFWQAEYMLSGMRDYVLSLACLRYGLNPSQGRGLDALPADVTKPFLETLVARLDGNRLQQALQTLMVLLLDEASKHTPEPTTQTREALRLLAQPV